MKNKKPCSTCEKPTKNKKYCSESCQYIGYKQERVEKIIIKCLNCSSEFKTTENKINNGKSKFCSRICKDHFQKTKFKGEGNPMYGKETSLTQKEKASICSSEQWKNLEFRKYFKEKIIEYYKLNGYYYGCSESSKEKRKKNYEERYGVNHNWKVKEIRDKCEKTCLELYGTNSWKIAQSYIQKKETSIEQKIKNILIKENIKFEDQYELYINEKEFKIYDFYLKDYNILIEADGDFWHANPKFYSSDNLHPIQKLNKKNDEFKNILAKKTGLKIIRFWEDDIKKPDFESDFLKKIKIKNK